MDERDFEDDGDAEIEHQRELAEKALRDPGIGEIGVADQLDLERAAEGRAPFVSPKHDAAHDGKSGDSTEDWIHYGGRAGGRRAKLGREAEVGLPGHVKRLSETEKLLREMEAVDDEPAGSYEGGILGRDSDPFVFGIRTSDIFPDPRDRKGRGS